MGFISSALFAAGDEGIAVIVLGIKAKGIDPFLQKVGNIKGEGDIAALMGAYLLLIDEKGSLIIYRAEMKDDSALQLILGYKDFSFILNF